MRRFFSYDDGEFSVDGEIVQAADSMGALLLFKDMALPNEREDLLLDDVIEVGDPELRFGPRPTCCSSAASGFPEKTGLPNEGRLIGLIVDSNEKPVWHIEPGVRIDYCPWCGSKLPNLEVNPDPPSPLQTAHKPDDGYCATCDERHMCCRCHPYMWAWRIRA